VTGLPGYFRTIYKNALGTATDVNTTRNELNKEKAHAGLPASILNSFSRRRLTRNKNSGGNIKARITPIHIMDSVNVLLEAGSKVNIKRTISITKTTAEPMNRPSRLEDIENVSDLENAAQPRLLNHMASSALKPQKNRKKIRTAIHSITVADIFLPSREILELE
jgi:hypothetical protein